MKKKNFEQKGVNEFFEKSRTAGELFLLEQLRIATTEKEKKKIRRLLKDFSPIRFELAEEE